ncbi:ABC transporter ATP-binding protein [Abyssisolibacter fermentans]|uniref:ABC transporter ATP-binding protein n=1 Tax=Abyssisolibacter fermentans TaxID=1766203 RepID=UPI00082C6DC8|nr:ABC transporter ATP-binding protein [Abyssisolibacter fermentans]
MIKKFISYYRPHMKLFILDMVAALLIAIIDLVFPILSRDILNEYIPDGNLRAIYISVAVLIVIYGLRAIFNYIVDYWGHVVGVRMEYDMRKDLFSHIQTLSFNFFDNTRTGHIMSRIVNDLREVSELAHHGPEDLFLSLIMLVGSFFILLTIEWRLTLVVFVFVPIMTFYAIKKRKKMSRAFKMVKKRIANVNSRLENSISGIRVAKSFTNEEYEMEKFDEGNFEFRESREEAFKSMAELTSGIHFFANILKILVIGIGGILIYRNELVYGDLVAFLLYIQFFLQPIRKLMQFTQQYEAGMAGFERFVEIMDVQPQIQNSEKSIVLDNIKGDIEFDKVTFSYNQDESVLSNIDLKISNGKTLALVGPSGGGKTTMCHLIPRFYDVNEGSVTLDGVNIKDIDIKVLRKNIGFVQQDIFLFSGTIKDNILYGKPDAVDAEVIEAAKKANIHSFICNLPDGYDTYVGEKGVRLSGGQKQRISIARVFLKNPPILILDEATSALDNETEIRIQKALEELSEGRTTLVIAHRLSTIKNADEIVVITNEGVKERGNHEELLEKKGIYEKLYKSQFRGYIPDDIDY